MKKIILILSMLVTMFAFSDVFYNGNYKVSLTKGQTIYEMDIIVRNNNIISTTFDIKKLNGRSIIFGDREKMKEKIEIEKMFLSGENIEKIEIFDKETTVNIKKLYYYLIEKVKGNDEGRFVL